MESIIPIKGNVQHTITLDPTVWIFDDRRIDLETFFTSSYVEKDELEEYKKEMGKHWSREIMEGATFPPTLKSERKFEKTQMLTGSFGISLTISLKMPCPEKMPKPSLSKRWTAKIIRFRLDKQRISS